MRITSKGQVTIPQDIRERAGFLPGTEVDFVVEPDGRVLLVEVEHARKATRGELIVRQLRGAFGPSDLTTDEFMALVRGYDEDADDPGFNDPERAGAA